MERAMRSELRATLQFLLEKGEPMAVLEVSAHFGMREFSSGRQLRKLTSMGILGRIMPEKHNGAILYFVEDMDQAQYWLNKKPQPRSPSVLVGRSNRDKTPKINSVFALGSL